MSDKPHPSDDELLETAIPIEGLDDEDASETPTASASNEEEDISQIDLIDDKEATHGTIRSMQDQKRQAVKWNRPPKQSDNGATFVKTFVAKLRQDAIEHMDEQINEWLDEHPEVDVKFATTTIGALTGKLKEEAIFVNVWV